MRKTPSTQLHVENTDNNLKDFDHQRNKLFNFPFLNKKEWLDIPVLEDKVMTIPEINDFQIDQQKTKDSCGICSAKMVVNTLLKQYNINKDVDEEDILRHAFLPKLGLVKKTIGITQSQLASGIQKLLNENNIDYTTEVRHLISYDQIKHYLKNGSYMIFSYMGNTIDNPYKFKNGKKDETLKDIHHPHYCVLLAIDEHQQKVSIANPFGYKDEIPFNEFWQRISLDPKYLRSSKLYIPLVESGLYMPRSCVIVSKNI